MDSPVTILLPCLFPSENLPHSVVMCICLFAYYLSQLQEGWDHSCQVYGFVLCVENSAWDMADSQQIFIEWANRWVMKPFSVSPDPSISLLSLESVPPILITAGLVQAPSFPSWMSVTISYPMGLSVLPCYHCSHRSQESSVMPCFRALVAPCYLQEEPQIPLGSTQSPKCSSSCYLLDGIFPNSPPSPHAYDHTNLPTLPLTSWDVLQVLIFVRCSLFLNSFCSPSLPPITPLEYKSL